MNSRLGFLFKRRGRPDAHSTGAADPIGTGATFDEDILATFPLLDIAAESTAEKLLRDNDLGASQPPGEAQILISQGDELMEEAKEPEQLQFEESKTAGSKVDQSSGNKVAAAINGNVDRFINGTGLAGWVIDQSSPSKNDIMVHLRSEGKVIASAVANLPRGDGYHGFDIKTSNTELALLLLEGKIGCCAVDQLGEFHELNLYGPMLGSVRESLVQMLCTRNVEKGGDFTSVSSTDHVITREPRSEDDLTPVLLPVGLVSMDGSAITGCRGNLFLYKGANDVAALHRHDETSQGLIRTANKWLDLFEHRSNHLRSEGAQYVQLIIPEKSSVLDTDAPPSISGATPLLKVIERLVCDRYAAGFELLGVPEFYCSLLSPLRSAQPGSPFLKTDSHLSETGCLDVFCHCIAQIGAMLPAEAAPISSMLSELKSLKAGDEKAVIVGDMARRFFGVPLYDVVAKLDLQRFSRHSVGISSTILREPADAHHTGTHIIWRNPNAPLRMKVVAFANSFFERGAAPRGLSWWFKNAFSEFHFIWSPELDEGFVRVQQPDVVVCQTIERFLHVIPQR